MKIVLHFKDGKNTELNPMLAKLVMKAVNISDLINNPTGQQSIISKFVNIDGLYSVEIIL